MSDFIFTCVVKFIAPYFSPFCVLSRNKHSDLHCSGFKILATIMKFIVFVDFSPIDGSNPLSQITNCLGSPIYKGAAFNAISREK